MFFEEDAAILGQHTFENTPCYIFIDMFYYVFKWFSSGAEYSFIVWFLAKIVKLIFVVIFTTNLYFTDMNSLIDALYFLQH